MKRARKILLWVVVVSLAALAIGWGALSLYVNSAAARRSAGEQLSQLVGIDVQVDRLGIGTSTTSIGLRVPDTTSESPADLVRIGSLQADVSLMDLLAGRVAPTTVTASDVELLLRLDEEGRSLSKPPKLPDSKPTAPTAIPKIELANARLRVQQTGHPEFDLGGIAGFLRREGDTYIFAGQLADPKWGAWRIDGRMAGNATSGRLELHAEEAPLDVQLLRSIPFVPQELWDRLVPSGTTVAIVALSFESGHGIDYRVELHPKQASLGFPAAGVTITKLTGRIVVGDGRVTVDGAQANLAEGTVDFEGVGGFGKSDRSVEAKVKANGIDIRLLPSTWGLPTELEGRMRGAADLRIGIGPDGTLDPRGSGTGEIDNAKFAGLNAKIQLKLTGGNGRYRFDAVK